jgi:Zn-dependent M28 family amino/carboxypeptidase
MWSRASLVVVIPLALAASLPIFACKPSTGAQGPDPSSSEPATPNPELGVSPALSVDYLRAMTERLAADELGGRLPGSPGAKLATALILAQMQAIGLEPAGDDGGWTQAVHMRGVTVVPEGTAVELGSGKGQALSPMAFEFGQHWVGTSFAAGTRHPIDAELVFVGYGVTAPEYGWDDYAGVDVKGKIVLAFVGDPPLADGRFAGEAMTYYGRWSYKFERALAAGAAGCLVIHEDAPASYGWNVPRTSFTGERFHVLTSKGEVPEALPLQGWISADAAGVIAQRNGSSLAGWHERALADDFQAHATRLRLIGTLTTSERQVDDVNLLGRLPGASSKAGNQAVILTGHWDHLGTDEAKQAAGEDGIYNGAIDNASGIAAMLGIAAELRRQADAGSPLDRSVVLLATTAEEQGLLGSEAWVAAPTLPLADVVAVINLDSMNVYGETKAVEVVGWGQTTLEDDLAPLAAGQGRTLLPDTHPAAGSFYRSDHFPFARAGVPALYFHSSLDMVDGGREAGEAIAAGVRARYHTPADEFDAAWSFTGAVQDAELVVGLLQVLGQAGVWPEYKAGSEFAGLR